MSKRLHVVLDDDEFEEIRRAARANGLTISEWVRQTLRAARRPEPANEVASKLRAIQRAAEYNFPTADPKQMIAEIERGYLE